MKAETPFERSLLRTVKIVAKDSKGLSSTGTGFFVVHNVNGNSVGFIVTCAHLVRYSKSGSMSFIKSENGQPKFGHAINVEINNFHEWWFFHPSNDIDIAVCLVDPFMKFAKVQLSSDIFINFFSPESVPSIEIINELDAVEEIYLTGYPSGILEEVNLLPITRRGITATPYSVDFNGRPEFLVDASVFPGSSGSPILMVEVGDRINRDGSFSPVNRTLLLGMITSVYYRNEDEEIIKGSIPDGTVGAKSRREMIDLGLAIKSREIVTAIRALVEFKTEAALSS